MTCDWPTTAAATTDTVCGEVKSSVAYLNLMELAVSIQTKTKIWLYYMSVVSDENKCIKCRGIIEDYFV